jgi:hypothetical protein
MLRDSLRPIVTAVTAAALLLLATSLSSAGAGTDCTLSVTPASGPPGTQFTFSGSGYTPTELRLTRDGAEPKVVPLDLQGADPFMVQLIAGKGDEGRWKAVASVDDTACQGVAFIRITLPSTATAEPAATSTDLPELAALTGLAVLFLVTAAVFVRRSRQPA